MAKNDKKHFSLNIWVSLVAKIWLIWLKYGSSFFIFIFKMTNPGLDVFAKVKGYSPWPATILEQTSNNKYKVYFFGTYEVGFVKNDQIWDFDEYVEEFSKKYSKKQIYAKALEEVREKRNGKYKPGENVFTQVRKQPPWPAKIIAAISKDTFYILFYGKSETLEEVTVGNMWKYEENCDVFSEKYKKCVYTCM